MVEWDGRLAQSVISSRKGLRDFVDTDDTERTVAVARAVIADRTISHVGVGREMLRCRKCVHPGVKSLWEVHQAADPTRIAKTHDGGGAAIRVAAVGIFLAAHRLEERLVRAAGAS